MISFVVPCYNEEGNVRLFYEEIHRVFDEKNIPIELIMVNDGSTDDTMNVLFSLYKEKRDPHLKIVRFSRNFGKEAAILSGLRHATGEYTCIIDADLQERPEVALELYEILEHEPDTDVAAAYQEIRHEGKFIAWWKRRFYHLINRLSEVNFKDGASDFRMFRKTVREALLSVPEYHRFSKGIFSFVGFETHYIPFEAEKRAAGKSKWSFRRLFRYAMDGIVGYSTVPLKISTVLGILFSMTAFIYMIVLVIKTLTVGVDVPGYATTVALILLIGGIQLLMLGIIGEYLAKAYIQGKNRPIYIEKEVLEGTQDGESVHEKDS